MKNENQNIASQVVGELKKHLENIIQDKLKKIILFGSYANKEQEKESDMDILILADLSETELNLLNKKLDILTTDLSLKYGVVVSPILKNTDTFFKYSEVLPFYRLIAAEGLTLYG